MQDKKGLTIAVKFSLLLIFVGLSTAFILGVSFYHSSVDLVVTNLGKRLEHIARTAALQISSDSHQKIVDAYLNQEKDIALKTDFKIINNFQ